jgi:hypothetical protein
MAIPGIDVLSARIILSEIDRDMSRFPTAGRLVSWAGLCPRNDESAGKRRSTRWRKGAPWLKTFLVQCAQAAARKKGSYFNAQFLRLRGRRGAKKATCAVAASLLTHGSQTLASMPSSLPSPKQPKIVAMLQSKRRSSHPQPEPRLWHRWEACGAFRARSVFW